MDFLFSEAFSVNNLLEVRDVLKVVLRLLTKEEKKDNILLFYYVANLLLCLIEQLVQLHVTQFTSRAIKGHIGQPPMTAQRWSPENWIFSVNKTKFREVGVLCNNRREVQSDLKRKKKELISILFLSLSSPFSGCIYHLCSYENNEAVSIVVLFVCKEHERRHKITFLLIWNRRKPRW